MSSWMNSGLRAILRNAVKFPGSLYQPILVENVPSGDALAEEVAALAEAAGISVVREMNMGTVDSLPSVGVWLLSVQRLALLPNFSEAEIPPRCQVILWSADLGTQIPPAHESWINSGLRYLASRGSSPKVQRYDEVSSALMLALRNPGSGYNPVVMVAENAQHDLLAVGAAIRFEAAGLSPVVDLSGPFTVQGETMRHRMAPGKSAWIVRVQDYQPESQEDEAFFRSLNAAVGAEILTLILLDPVSAQRMYRHPRWSRILTRGITLNVNESGPLAPAEEYVPTTLLREDDAWPPLRSVLAGRPFYTQRSDSPPFSGKLDDQAALGVALQWPYMLRRTGRLVVYNAKEYGYIDFWDGSVVHAGPAERWVEIVRAAEGRGLDLSNADVQRDLAEALIHDRICEMSEWKDTRFVFLVVEPATSHTEEVRLSAESVAFEIARRYDEKPRLLRSTGGLGRIWIRIDEAPVPSDATPESRALWAALDGERSLGEVAGEIGLTTYDALTAAEFLARTGHIFIVREGEWRERSPGPSMVARALWAEGLVEEGNELLERVVAEGDLSPDLLWLCAWTLVEKGEWEEAYQVFAEAQESPNEVERLCAVLNTALIGVRLGRLSPSVGLNNLEAHGLLSLALSQGEPRDGIAGCVELCLRTRRMEEVEKLLPLVPDESVSRKLREALAGSRG